MTTKLIISNGIFASLRPGAPRTAVTGTMVIENDMIVYVGEQLPQEHDTPEAVRIDGKGLFFIPGLINTHGHAAMALLRGYGDDMVLQTWLQEKMWPMEAKFTAEDVRWGRRSRFWKC